MSEPSWVPLGISAESQAGPAGPQGPPGSTGPQGPQGNPGATGSQGPAGADGEVWYSGTGTPAGATGAIGDWYINTTTSDVYEKTAAATWTLRLNIKGAQGPQGIQGPQGNAGSQGIQGPAGSQGIQGPAGVVTAFREGHTFALAGDLSLLPATLPSIFIPMSGTQSTILRAVRTKIVSGTSVGVQVKRNGSNVGGVITVTPTVVETSLGNVALANADELTIVLSALTGTPISLTSTFVLETTAT